MKNLPDKNIHKTKACHADFTCDEFPVSFSFTLVGKKGKTFNNIKFKLGVLMNLDQ